MGRRQFGDCGGVIGQLYATTLSIVSGPITLALTVPSTTGGGGNLVFTFTSQMLNSLVPTLPVTGSIVDTLTGTLTATGATGLDVGSPVVDSQSCSQPVIGGVPGAVSCSDTLIVGTLATTGAPEPASLALLGSALAGFGVLARRRKRL